MKASRSRLRLMYSSEKYLENAAKNKKAHKAGPPLKTGHDTWTRSPRGKANVLAEHFSEVLTPHPSSTTDPVLNIHDQENANDSPAIPWNKVEVKAIIRSLQHRKAGT